MSLRLIKRYCKSKRVEFVIGNSALEKSIRQGGPSILLVTWFETYVETPAEIAPEIMPNNMKISHKFPASLNWSLLKNNNTIVYDVKGFLDKSLITARL